MEWTIDFISQEDFKKHVKNTIKHYGTKLVSYDVKKFNRNFIDPVKMIFDKAVYGEDWETIIANEIFRQRDKSNTNEIGYFHQRIFNYIEHCRVPDNGKEGGWDVIYESPEGYVLDNGNEVAKVCVELKNKHNTMNSSSAGKTYMKMQNQLLHDDNCVCFLVEAIAARSQNIIWQTTVDGQKVSHNRIRRVSIDRFYEIVTGQSDAFYQICKVLPEIVKEVIDEGDELAVPKDKVYEEIKRVADGFEGTSENMGMILAMYMLGFSTYNEFDCIADKNTNID
ncbi:Eco47II family restriction endonuclease [Eremococcus coleocola]|uniref:Eco47II restriction endonuclease n=1 Tax=Eremococcus coleocola ACS-139-V-Col8 TaxID=908337 RepID=E4KME8_9LACT|nr:Eco47II family restriction endonuclease [Eremococcus coleocola]EFR31838.1 Eco47II restriction endonuclease [Eremococcus coleocola ACS-139-V-Col8]